MWDPYRIEGIPKGAQFIQLDRASENPIRDILHLVQREFSKDQPSSLVIGLEGEDLTHNQFFDLRFELTQFLKQAHRQRPIPKDVVVAVGIPRREAALLFRAQGEAVQVERVFLDSQGGVTLRADDTTDEAVEASLEGLQSAHGFLQGRVGSELRLKHTPTLTFFHDDTAERAQRLERLMDEQS
jgi:hypothetical protein